MVKTDAVFQKKELRGKAKDILSSLGEDYIRSASAAICKSVLECEEYLNASAVFCYVSTASEPDTRPILLDALSKGKTLLVPRCTGKGIMETVEIHSLSDLGVGAYGIKEPLPYVMSTCVQPEFSIIPCVCCDRRGNRLGHGGGYYDRFMEKTQCKNAVMCFERLIVDAVPTEAHDIRVDTVITEMCTY